MTRPVAFFILIILGCLTLAAYPAFANDPPDQEGKENPVVSPLLQQFIQDRSNANLEDQEENVAESKVLGRGADSGVSTKNAPSGSSSTESEDDPVRFDSSGNVQVYIHVNTTEDDKLQQIRNLGADIEITNADMNVIQAWIPVSALSQIADLDAVQEIVPPDYGETEAGRVTTEGDGIHRSNLVRTFNGITGRGVKVGVISDGVSAHSTSISSRDLPRDIDIFPDRRGRGHEGTALLEIVHDLAPNAQLAFAPAGTSLEFIKSILWLANDAFDGEGADIIVDDFAYYSEPFFEDGLIAKAAADAVDGGAVFASSAGNSSYSHYDGEFVDEGDDFHDFDDDPNTTDVSMRIRVGSRIFLQWNDEFGASGNDYDLFLCPPGLRPTKFNLQNEVCEGSTREQNGDDDAIEHIYTVGLGFSVGDLYIPQVFR